ncbi:MAG: rRNA maturation RNase YbeY [Planctomycetota bacterium]
MTEVVWAAEGLEPFVEEADVARAAAAALAFGGRAGVEVGVIFVREPELTALHADHLDDPTATDVITFDLGSEGDGPVGELYISVDRALEVARARGGRAADELLLYVVHGCLHLAGHDDHEADARAAMRAAEREVLAQLGVRLVDGPHEFGDA